MIPKRERENDGRESLDEGERQRQEERKNKIVYIDSVCMLLPLSFRSLSLSKTTAAQISLKDCRRRSAAEVEREVGRERGRENR